MKSNFLDKKLPRKNPNRSKYFNRMGYFSMNTSRKNNEVRRDRV